jgi:hypothetical protein
MKIKSIAYLFMIKIYNAKQISCGCPDFRENIWSSVTDTRTPTNHRQSLTEVQETINRTDRTRCFWMLLF